ncbi:GntR family transcriptional regulator [Aidingimonas halophila]|uniref:Transcriptional regulator, GntR family n=1 Tax=Aidingimonas halophila TaxID=574349 RepID=A0A1H3HU94_9GAMM|nr:GntR family transcriptional regulator [Aidingimonas halophila]GHC38922.1 GntR family transcriptional regulator [Aidingimonas halophila]SDY18269.1 transcriptional regulator, GntR family [Aidingimonas halophila]
MKTLKEQLYSALNKGLESGRLEPGLVLLEGNIADLFGMSRSPVRQTLRQLHDEGKISRFDGRGYLVGEHPDDIIRRPLTHDDIKDVEGMTSVERQDSWLLHAETVERDVVLSSMKGRFELNELQLARVLDVSRTVTHRILLHLQSIGVLEKVKYSSWNVVPLDDDRLHNLYEARRQLEPFMIGRATTRIPREQVEDYINKLSYASEHYPDIKSDFLDELENDLHCDAISQGANQEILNMLSRTRPILLISKHLLGDSIALPDEEPFFDEHRWVFDKILKLQAAEASKALDEHLTRSESKVLDRLALFRAEGRVDIPPYLKDADK